MKYVPLFCGSAEDGGAFEALSPAERALLEQRLT